jgi:hypothetical protein
MDWRPYGPCCPRYAADADVAFCPECRHPLLRCMAFAECHSLVTPNGPCPACVAPSLMIDAGATVRSKAGERLSVPFILRNASPAGRALWVKYLARRDGHGDEPLALTWEHVEAGSERRFSVNTPPLESGGTHELGLVAVLSTRYRGVEEEYAFTASVLVTVSGQKGPQTIQQTTIVHGAQSSGGVATAGAVNAPLNIQLGEDSATATLKDRTPVPLERAERYELEHEVRGYRGEELRVPRHVAFSFFGFRPAECPPGSVTLDARGRLSFGRNGRTAQGADGIRNDVSLRVYDRAGATDEPASLAISRHHFDLIVANERLCVHVRTTRGMQLNGRDLAPGAVAAIHQGDHLTPVAGATDRLSLKVVFTASIDGVERIDVRRDPEAS